MYKFNYRYPTPQALWCELSKVVGMERVLIELIKLNESQATAYLSHLPNEYRVPLARVELVDLREPQVSKELYRVARLAACARADRLIARVPD